ncbi:MAG: hypothetical protein N2035_06135, partial [Chthoniobacterales bacterium]|nr:hypothetical protein [Chthoniobacterales bacterium]
LEAIRKRPFSQRSLEILQSAFALLLIAFMLYVTFYDVLDLPWKSEHLPKPELKFPSPQPPQSETPPLPPPTTSAH